MILCGGQQQMIRRKGFTLIELLVVIAIIGILAAMLFPVFARARESARKIQCLSNVKNIALATQMYLGDYDRFPTDNRDTEWARWLPEDVSGESWEGSCASPHRINRANPYLRWPVMLDEYVKNRDIWRCPSARNFQSADVVIPQYTPIWWQYVVNTWDGSLQPCDHGSWYPPGWGGTLTDSVVQGTGGESTGGFEQSLGVTLQQSAGLSTSTITDPSNWLVVGDNAGGLDIRRMFDAVYAAACCWDLGNDDCSCTGDAFKFYSDPSFRKQYAPHLAGVNLGFADGHASWWSGEAAVQAAGTCCNFPDANGNWATCVPATEIQGTCGDVWHP